MRIFFFLFFFLSLSVSFYKFQFLSLCLICLYVYILNLSQSVFICQNFVKFFFLRECLRQIPLLFHIEGTVNEIFCPCICFHYTSPLYSSKNLSSSVSQLLPVSKCPNPECDPDFLVYLEKKSFYILSLSLFLSLGCLYMS